MYLTQALHRALQQHPNQIAVHFGRRSKTFAELADRVARLAGALQTLGVGTGDRVAMLALNSDRYLEYQMAVPWAGAVLNPCNIRWSVAEIAYSLNDSGSTVLFVDETFRAMIEPLKKDSPTLRESIYCGHGEVPPGTPDYEALIRPAAPVPEA